MPERRQATRQSRPYGPVVAVFVRVSLPGSLPATSPRSWAWVLGRILVAFIIAFVSGPMRVYTGRWVETGDGQITCWLDLGLRIELHLPSRAELLTGRGRLVHHPSPPASHKRPNRGMPVDGGLVRTADLHRERAPGICDPRPRDCRCASRVSLLTVAASRRRPGVTAAAMAGYNIPLQMAPGDNEPVSSRRPVAPFMAVSRIGCGCFQRRSPHTDRGTDKLCTLGLLPVDGAEAPHTTTY
jgi:hypothetical protein